MRRKGLTHFWTRRKSARKFHSASPVTLGGCRRWRSKSLPMSSFWGSWMSDCWMSFTGAAGCSSCRVPLTKASPSVTIEAMLRGKPVICSRIGGLPEIVDDGVTGLLFTPGDPADLAAKIEWLWNSSRPLRCNGPGRSRESVARVLTGQGTTNDS